MMKWNQLEVDGLDERPNHPILLQCLPVRAIEFLLRALAFHNSHAAQEDEHVGGREDNLVAGDTCDDFEILVREDDLVLKEFEPGCCGRTEDSCTELSAWLI
jgi:hypothetical protein